jgi:transcriptional regulator with XRE-family HTH domain
MMTPAELKEERNRLGLSVEAMAERLHLSKGTYLKYEYGQRAVPDDIDWRVSLAEKDPCGLALLILERTKEFGWEQGQERQIGEEIVGMMDDSVK